MKRMMCRRTRKVVVNERGILPVCGSSQRWIFVRATSGSSCAPSFHSDGCFTSDLGSYDGGDDTCGNACSQEIEKAILLCKKAMEQMRATSDQQRWFIIKMRLFFFLPGCSSLICTFSYSFQVVHHQQCTLS
ncbi:hypothetical protein BDL97_11G091200 [Sphagnum fallax]|nr:hypothetical protein BDL97_11G091200 [Sphagnum fallax]